MTFSDRIKTAMQAKGWNPKPSDLMRQWNEKYPKHEISRTTANEWMGAKKPKITPKNLFMLADLLDVNARWFALMGNADRDSMTKPKFLDPDLRRVTDAYDALLPGFREDLVKEANRLLARQDEASKAHPFKSKH